MSDPRESVGKAVCASLRGCRLIADRVGDVIWMVEFPASNSSAEQMPPFGDLDAAAIVDAILEHWRFSFADWAAEQVFGYRQEEIAGLALRDLASPTALATIRRELLRDIQESRNAAAPEGRSRERFLELEFLAKDRSPRWCEVTSTLIRNGNAVPTGVLGVTRDVTERRQAARALRESEGKLRCLFENLPDFVVVVDRAGRMHYVNRGQSGLERDALSGTCAFDYLIPEYHEPCRQALDGAMAGSCRNLEARDVFGTYWSIRMVPLPGDEGADRAMIICTDVTHERLAAASVAKEQQLLRQMLDLHERERQLIAYDIHDGFSQQLTGAMFRLEGFRDSLAANPTDAWQTFEGAMRLLRRAIDETRRLITGLRPPILDEMGIVEAVQYLVYEHNKDAGPTIEFDHDLSRERFSPPLESAVFRIVQESLQNACRHSRGDRVLVSLADRADRIVIDVRDWGVGFDPEAVVPNRFGLSGMRERVRLLDGRIVIESSPNQGTRVSVELPIAEEEA